ncbi:hypothetical protein VTL71DRAFT_14769 [Oculimacula yallundae]|uniref:Heterokaryon incompatibility domain-containing protein n=1 Tax=Oculimacula yallundae TaxID=86028 RepID=A0ABR4CJE7_9HELO
MDTQSCPVCHSDSEHFYQNVDGRSIYFDGLKGLHIRVDDLAKGVLDGCQPCTLLLNTLQVFQSLSPGFEASYPGSTVDSILIQSTAAGSILVTLRAGYHSVDQIELYTRAGSLPFWPGLECGTEVLEDLSLKKATSTITQWMTACKQHSSCLDIPSLPLPTRVLLIGQHEISLLESAGRSGKYATLSHCWGTSQPLTTTRDNLIQHCSGIRWSSLPQLFQDAVALTRELGIRYLWVDSLCIIQGDELDWTRESGQMASIYSNSYLNIAATAAAGSNESLFSKRWTSPLRYVHDTEVSQRRPMTSYAVPMPCGNLTVRARYSARCAHEHVKILHSPPSERIRSEVWRQGPLLTRSWAFQERFLSPRTVHFHASEMLWECNDNFRCECDALRMEDAGMYGVDLVVGKRWMYEMLNAPEDPDENGYLRLDRWLDGVKHYSRLAITQPADRLPALAGLATSFAKRIQSSYFAGLWYCDLPRSLCWLVMGEEYSSHNNTYYILGKPCNSYTAPSWSWAAVDLSEAGNGSNFGAHISFRHLIHRDFVADDRFELIGIDCTVDPVSPFGKVTDGVLNIRVAALQCLLILDAPTGSFLSYGEHRLYADLDFNDDQFDRFCPRRSDYTFGTTKDLRELDVRLVLIGTSRGDADNIEMLALVLTSVPNIPDKFQRIGILKRADEGWFENAEVRTVKVL